MASEAEATQACKSQWRNLEQRINAGLERGELELTGKPVAQLSSDPTLTECQCYRTVAGENEFFNWSSTTKLYRGAGSGANPIGQCDACMAGCGGPGRAENCLFGGRFNWSYGKPVIPMSGGPQRDDTEVSCCNTLGKTGYSTRDSNLTACQEEFRRGKDGSYHDIMNKDIDHGLSLIKNAPDGRFIALKHTLDMVTKKYPDDVEMPGHYYYIDNAANACEGVYNELHHEYGLEKVNVIR